MTIESEVASLTTATTSLLTAVNVAKSTLDAKVVQATDQAILATNNGAAQVTLAAAQATAAAANAASVATVNAVATTQAGLAATSAAAAATARDLSIAAWAASTAPAELLAAKSQSLHVGAIVKAIVYDTSRDSDGGAWRQRCQDKSWYTETLGGDRWIGQYATIAAAWAAAGTTTGAVFQASATAGPLTVGKFYTATSATTATEVFRGITRDFPAVAGIVAESARVVIYDLSTGAMWMVFVNGGGSYTLYFIGANPTSLAAINGTLVVGMIATANPQSYTGHVMEARFASDKMVKRHGGYNQTATSLVSLSFRNSTSAGFSYSDALASTNCVAVSGGSALDGRTNDVAITVLDNAPIDPATGLPVPTIAVATGGGLSLIHNNGTVINNTNVNLVRVAISRGRVYGVRNASGGVLLDYGLIPDVIAGSGSVSIAYRYTAGSTPALTESANAIFATTKDALAVGSTASYPDPKLMILKDAPNSATGLLNSLTKGMVAYITNAYNSGWMPGDIRGAYLADTTAETVTGSGELVTNGTFATDTSGWVATQSTGAATIAFSSGKALVSNAGSATNAGIQQMIATVVGKTYVYSAAFSAGGGYSLRITAATSAGSGSIAASSTTSGDRTDTITFVATTTTTYLTAQVISSNTAASFEVDNISVKLADPDRSVKNNGLIINGTLTKTAVATGAGLVAYSGFSAANYLEQPYSTNYNFTIPEFSGSLWLKQAPNTAIEYLINRDSATPAQAIRLWVSVAGFLVFEVFDGTTTRTATGTAIVDDNTLKLVQFACVGGTTLNIYVNGALYATATGAALLTLANTAAVLRIGESVAGGSPLTNGSIALVRIGATVPSADQRELIYRTELPLFQAGAQCTLAGTSTAVTALAYDDVTDLLHVGTSWGRTSFEGLLRIDSEATTTGALTSLSAQGGTVITGGTSGRLYVPAKYLRDELQRREVARQALGRTPVYFDLTTTWAITGNTTSGSPTLTATAGAVTGTVGMAVSGTAIPNGTTILAVSGTGATAVYTLSANATATATGTIVGQGYILPKGYRAIATYLAGVKLVNRTSGVRVESSTDGFANTVSLYPGVAIGSEISVMAVRE